MPESDIYRGDTPFSEIESRLLAQTMRQYKPNKYVGTHANADGIIHSASGTAVATAMRDFCALQGFVALSLMLSSSSTGTSRGFAEENGAMAFTYETRAAGTSLANAEDVNRFIAAMISFCQAEISEVWSPQLTAKPIM